MHVLEGHTCPITTILVLNTTPNDCNETLILSASSKEMILWELSSDERFDPESNIKVITEHEGSVNVSYNKTVCCLIMTKVCSLSL